MTACTRRRGLALASGLASAVFGCGGGTPLLHPARTLTLGDVRAAAGMSGNVTVGSAADDLRAAREIAATDPNAPGPPGTNPGYAKGALVAASLAPGVAPFVSARVGVGSRFEGGIAYTGRGARIDFRRSFDWGPWSLSLGVGGSAALYGRQQGTPLPSVDLGQARGWGADVPIVVGAQTDDGLYAFWAGARAGWEHVRIEQLTSEPKPVTFGVALPSLSARRFWGGVVAGGAIGYGRLHVAFELAVAYQDIAGAYNATQVDVRGVTIAPATALWWAF